MHIYAETSLVIHDGWYSRISLINEMLETVFTDCKR
jgi:hypothetical protein